jgi:hypothetical protein
MPGFAEAIGMGTAWKLGTGAASIGALVCLRRRSRRGARPVRRSALRSRAMRSRAATDHQHARDRPRVGSGGRVGVGRAARTGPRRPVIVPTDRESVRLPDRERRWRHPGDAGRSRGRRGAPRPARRPSRPLVRGRRGRAEPRARASREGHARGGAREGHGVPDVGVRDRADGGRPRPPPGSLAQRLRAEAGTVPHVACGRAGALRHGAPDAEGDQGAVRAPGAGRAGQYAATAPATMAASSPTP